jgi:hypothetical protein
MPTFCDRICDSDVEALEAIRSACHGLLPSWQLPERFFEQRSSITGALTKLIRLLASEPRTLGRAVPGLRVVVGGGPVLTAPVLPARSRYAAPRAQALSLSGQPGVPAPCSPAGAAACACPARPRAASPAAAPPGQRPGAIAVNYGLDEQEKRT